MPAELLPLTCGTCGKPGKATSKADDASLLCACIICEAPFALHLDGIRPPETVTLIPNTVHPRLLWCTPCGRATRHLYRTDKMPWLLCLECEK